jgi:hypothetical protein
LQAAVNEISALQNGQYAESIDQMVTNAGGKLQEVVDQILNAFRSSDREWAQRSFTLRNDRYRNARGGIAFVYELRCAACSRPILIYQKDGRGGLHRCYLNRILAPAQLANLQVMARFTEPANLADLACSHCGLVIGTLMRHSDGRLAFRLRQGTFQRKAIADSTK